MRKKPPFTYVKGDPQKIRGFTLIEKREEVSKDVSLLLFLQTYINHVVAFEVPSNDADKYTVGRSYHLAFKETPVFFEQGAAKGPLGPIPKGLHDPARVEVQIHPSAEDEEEDEQEKDEEDSQDEFGSSKEEPPSIERKALDKDKLEKE